MTDSSAGTNTEQADEAAIRQALVLFDRADQDGHFFEHTESARAALDRLRDALSEARAALAERDAVIEQLRTHGGDWIVEGAAKELDDLGRRLAVAERERDERGRQARYFEDRWQAAEREVEALREALEWIFADPEDPLRVQGHAATALARVRSGAREPAAQAEDEIEALRALEQIAAHGYEDHREAEEMHDMAVKALDSLRRRESGPRP